MIKYNSLRHNKDGLPTFDSFLVPVYKIWINDSEYTKKYVTQLVRQQLTDTPKDLLKLTNKKGTFKIDDNITWASGYLNLAKLIKPTDKKKHLYKITPYGHQIWQKYGEQFNLKILKSLPTFQKHEHDAEQKKTLKKQDKVKPAPTFVPITQENVDNYFQKQLFDFKQHLLNRLRQTDPYEFERMMTDLLSKLGYKGVNGEALTTQKSGDGGIDGIINQDALGLDTIYLQVKRYSQENKVGSPEIEAFSGALRRKKADKGVFITSGEFTSDAQSAASDLSITLVDGEMLVNLMVEYHVGVDIKKQYLTYKIDEDFFN